MLFRGWFFRPSVKRKASFERDKLRVRMYFPRQNSRDYFLSLFFFFLADVASKLKALLKIINLFFVGSCSF